MAAARLSHHYGQMSERGAPKPVNVLVVDDDETIRQMLRIALGVQDGVGEIFEAGDGTEALEACKVFLPDLILLDYWMPLMDGATAAPFLREIVPDARIVAFSGVLDRKPAWADEWVLKGDLPDLEVLIDLCHTAA